MQSFACSASFETQAIVHRPRYYFDPSHGQAFLNVIMLKHKLLAQRRVPVDWVCLGVSELVF